MKKRETGWIAGLVFLLALVAIPVWYFTGTDDTVAGQVPDSPWDNVPRRAEPVAHDSLMEGPFETGQQVTQACLNCHSKDHGLKFVGVTESCHLCHGDLPENHTWEDNFDCLDCHDLHGMN